MTNRLAILFGLTICGTLAVDYALFDFEYSLFLSRKFLDLIEWMAVWR